MTGLPDAADSINTLATSESGCLFFSKPSGESITINIANFPFLWPTRSPFSTIRLREHTIYTNGVSTLNPGVSMRVINLRDLSRHHRFRRESPLLPANEFSRRRGPIPWSAQLQRLESALPEMPFLSTVAALKIVRPLVTKSSTNKNFIVGGTPEVT